MEWERAKNIILIAFILLNLGLAAMVFWEQRRYTMTPEQEHHIRTVLGQNNIQVYTNPLRRFPPMQALEISGFYYDRDALLEIFFEDPASVMHTVDEFGADIYETYAGRLEISNGFIFFRNTLGNRDGVGLLSDGSADEPDNDEDTPAPRVERSFAAALTNEFINRHFPDFENDITVDVYDISGNQYGVRRTYLEVYRGQRIYSNFVEFFVTHQGIKEIEMQFGRILGYSGAPRMIFAPDEILLTFMQRFRHIAMENPIFINRIDIVYLKEYYSDQFGSVSRAVPFYRIFKNGNDFPFFINAFTNTIID